jgi:SAM-dependent methyltransferase
LDQKKLDQQSQHWEKNFSSKPEMFGLNPSAAAIKALKIFKKRNITNIIELGAGLGRDTIFFAKNSIHVYALDYSISALNIINQKAKEQNLLGLIKTEIFDIRKTLKFSNESFQCFYSHMLYCMAFNNLDLLNLNNEIFRVLKKDGINIYTVRNTSDDDYMNGVHRGEDLYENDGFIVNFFSKEKIQKLSKGFKNIKIEYFEEGSFPRKLFFVENHKLS